MQVIILADRELFARLCVIAQSHNMNMGDVVREAHTRWVPYRLPSQHLMGCW